MSSPGCGLGCGEDAPSGLVEGCQAGGRDLKFHGRAAGRHAARCAGGSGGGDPAMAKLALLVSDREAPLGAAQRRGEFRASPACTGPSRPARRVLVMPEQMAMANF